MATITHKLMLSTKEDNLVGEVKVRQADDETQLFEVTVLENGTIKNFAGLKPFFCLMAREVTGQGVSEEPVTVYDETKGTLKYTLSANAMQMVGRNEAYFSFRKELTNGSWAEQFSTRSFFYTVEKSIYTQPFKDSNYWFTFKELYRLFNDYIESGKLTWEDFMDTESDLWKNFINQNREIIESVDPGGVVLTELIDARYSPFFEEMFPNLKQRLDHIETHVDARFTHNENHHFNAQKFNIPSDGVTSCVTALRAALAILPDYSTLVFERNKSYLIDDAIIITNQGITLDFNGSTIIYNSNVDYGTINGSSRNIGALIVKGSLSSATTTVTGIDSLFGVSRWDSLYPDFSRRLTVADGSLFQKGDLAFLSYYNNGSKVFSTDFSDNPASLNIPVKINRVWGNEIAVSLKEDFKWTDVAQIGTLTKINPIKDVSILNMRFKDDSVHTLPASESDITTEMKKSWVNGIYFEYAENLTIENYRAENIWFAGLRFHRCYNVHVADVVAQRAKYFTGGNGYGIQITESHKGKLERIDGNDLRHLIDLTASGSFTIEDCGAYSTGSSGFDLHGKGEFDIVYTRCSGQFGFSNGFPEFACMVGSVRMSDCNIKFVAQYGSLWVLSLQIDRSQIEMSNDTSINGTNVHISNSTIRITNTRRTDYEKTYELGIFSNTRKGFYEDMSILHIDSVDVYYETEFRLPNKFKIGKFKFTTINNLNCINRTILKLVKQESYPTLIIYAEHLNASGITVENWLVELNGGTPTHPFYTSITDTFLDPLSTKVINLDKVSIITNKNYSGQSGKTNNLLNIRGFDSVGEFGIGTVITLNKLYIFKNTASSDRWIRAAENVGLVAIKTLDATLMGNVLSYSLQGGTGFVLPTLTTKDTVISNTLTLATVVPGT